jgi:hypothetical protein
MYDDYELFAFPKSKGETEFEERARLQRENPLYTRHTDQQIRSMLDATNPEWFDCALRQEAHDRGMITAPCCETKLIDVINFLRERFPK